MPTYEYRCDGCGFHFERFQGMLEEPVKICPRCGGRVRRLIGAGGGIIFKGKGFYATDYRSGSRGSSCWSKPGASRTGAGKKG